MNKLNSLTFVFDPETGIISPFVSRVSISEPILNPETGLFHSETILDSVPLADALNLIV